MSKPDEDGPGAARIDRWLFAVRLFKSRSAATEAVHGGRVHLNGERIKASHAVKAGDAISFSRGAVVFECTVLAIPVRRGPASSASRCYEELPASQARRQQYLERRQLVAGSAPRSEERPDKHGRRLLRQLRGRH
jgi:ribosome-associated heat shock protein Hsp15